MQLISKINKGFQKILDISNRRPKTILDKSGVFYNRSMKSWLQKNAIEVYSTHNEGKSVIFKKFNRTLKVEFINT